MANDQDFDRLVEESLRKLNARYAEVANQKDLLEITSLLQRADADMLAVIKEMLEGM